MKFDLVYRLQRATPSLCAELFFDPKFMQATRAVAGVKVLEEIERRDEGARVHLSSRVVPDRAIPAPLASLLKGEIAFLEDSVFDRESLTVDWRSRPTVWSDRLDVSGRTSFRGEGDDVERRLTGELRVRAAGLGGMIERLVVADMKVTHGRITALAQQWIDDGWRS